MYNANNYYDMHLCLSNGVKEMYGSVSLAFIFHTLYLQFFSCGYRQVVKSPGYKENLDVMDVYGAFFKWNPKPFFGQPFLGIEKRYLHTSLMISWIQIFLDWHL